MNVVFALFNNIEGKRRGGSPAKFSRFLHVPELVGPVEAESAPSTSPGWLKNRQALRDGPLEFQLFHLSHCLSSKSRTGYEQ